MRFIKLLSLFMIFIITGCQVQPILETPTRLPAPQTLTTPVPSETPILRTLSPTPIPTTPIPSFTPLPLSTATSIALPSSTATATTTPAATLITPIVQGGSLGGLMWSPDSRWLPFEDFQAQRLHFSDVLNSATCDFPAPISDWTPYRNLAWLSDGRAVVQAAGQVLSGRPCETFAPASADEILALDHTDPSFSPGGRYQVVFQRGAGNSQGVEATIELKEWLRGRVSARQPLRTCPEGAQTCQVPGSIQLTF